MRIATWGSSHDRPFGALVAPLVFESLGAYITLGLFGTTLLVLIARLPPLLAVMATGVGLAACWYFFQVLLGLQLPTGPLWAAPARTGSCEMTGFHQLLD